MTTGSAPRVVVVRRPTEYELLIEQHGTRAQAQFYLERQGQALASVEERHARVGRALEAVRARIPRAWRNANLIRADLDRFVFEPKDIIVAVGQDGLVANVAKYLDGQYVIGINPDPAAYEGVLVPHSPAAVGDLLADCEAHRAATQSRTMVEVRLDDGQRIIALNEIFIGHHSHQSARYRIVTGAFEERQSSSGFIISTGTGATGWARSINRERKDALPLPAPQDAKLAFFAREAFPGSGFQTSLTSGILLEGGQLRIISEMNAGGVVFGDGMEDDRLEFLWGSIADIAISKERLELVAA
jgi:NAD kinase